MLLSFAILFAMNHGRRVVPFTDWLTWRIVTRPSEVWVIIGKHHNLEWQNLFLRLSFQEFEAVLLGD